MMKKIEKKTLFGSNRRRHGAPGNWFAAVLLIFFGAVADAFGGCSCNHVYHNDTATDSITKATMICTWYTQGVRIYDETKGVVRTCVLEKNNDAGCSGDCRAYTYIWQPGNGSCIGGMAIDATHIEWRSSPWSWVCWQPHCKQEKEYWQETIGKGAQYKTCSRCQLRIVEVDASDPTEYSFVKIIPDRNADTGCMAGAQIDTDCVGYQRRRGTDGPVEDKSCAKKGCKCGGSAQEYKVKGDDDWYIRC